LFIKVRFQKLDVENPSRRRHVHLSVLRQAAS
jgi:hypothetical protein